MNPITHFENQARLLESMAGTFVPAESFARVGRLTDTGDTYVSCRLGKAAIIWDGEPGGLDRIFEVIRQGKPVAVRLAKSSRVTHWGADMNMDINVELYLEFRVQAHRAPAGWVGGTFYRQAAGRADFDRLSREIKALLDSVRL